MPSPRGSVRTGTADRAVTSGGPDARSRWLAGIVGGCAIAASACADLEFVTVSDAGAEPVDASSADAGDAFVPLPLGLSADELRRLALGALAGSDSDGDGRSDLDEYNDGTDP